ncbi:MAG: hypothetical protein AAF730_11995 [Bacteroidota bacterium]
MATAYFFDTNAFASLLGKGKKAVHRKRGKALKAKLRQIHDQGHLLYVPHMVQHEVERLGHYLTMTGKEPRFLQRFNRAVYSARMRKMEVTPSALNKATMLWADLMQRNLSVGNKSLEGDLLILGEVLTHTIAHDKVVVTDNVKHFEHVVDVLTVADFLAHQPA